MRNPTAFVSYSWDNEAHQQWVINLVNDLRKNGIDAKLDVHITQTNTVNLNQMMVSNLRENDYIIVVLTENYADRANKFQGGVGFETILSLPILQHNLNKIIFINRCQGNFQDAFPFHLEGYYAINFSNDGEFDKSFKELIHRILNEPLYEVEPLGKLPDLSKSTTIQQTERISTSITDFKIPNLKGITDKEIDEFLYQSFQDITKLMIDLLRQVASNNSNFEFSENKIDNTKSIFKIYLDGSHKTSIKIWLGGMFGRETIQLAYGRNIDVYADNSCNESITHKIDEDNNLSLKLTMNLFMNEDPDTPEKVVKNIWKNNIMNCLK